MVFREGGDIGGARVQRGPTGPGEAPLGSREELWLVNREGGALSGAQVQGGQGGLGGAPLGPREEFWVLSREDGNLGGAQVQRGPVDLGGAPLGPREELWVVSREGGALGGAQVQRGPSGPGCALIVGSHLGAHGVEGGLRGPGVGRGGRRPVGAPQRPSEARLLGACPRTVRWPGGRAGSQRRAPQGRPG